MSLKTTLSIPSNTTLSLESLINSLPLSLTLSSSRTSLTLPGNVKISSISETPSSLSPLNSMVHWIILSDFNSPDFEIPVTLLKDTVSLSSFGSIPSGVRVAVLVNSTSPLIPSSILMVILNLLACLVKLPISRVNWPSWITYELSSTHAPSSTIFSVVTLKSTISTFSTLSPTGISSINCAFSRFDSSVFTSIIHSTSSSASL